MTEPSSFRPISLLDGMGKLLERLLLNKEAAFTNAALAPSQFGFRLGRGAQDAICAALDVAAEAAKGVTQDRYLCVLVTLDVKNAFNTAPWGRIDEACARIGLPKYIRRIIRSYLTDRYILVPSEGRLTPRRMMCGVPQGSVLGSTLWNIFYDGVLRLGLPEGASIIGFSDDLALLVINHTTEGLEANTNQALRVIDDWINRSGLTLAHHKTEAVMLTRKWA